jgi:hypothetical protein
MKVFACLLVICFGVAFAKTDTLVTVNCKCDTLKVIKTVDTTVTIKLDTLKATKKPTTLKK